MRRCDGCGRRRRGGEFPSGAARVCRSCGTLAPILAREELALDYGHALRLMLRGDGAGGCRLVMAVVEGRTGEAAGCIVLAGDRVPELRAALARLRR